MSTPDTSCLKCGGTGSVEVEWTSPHPPTFRRCDCVLYKDILENVERGLKGLSIAPVIKSTPLYERDEESLWITAGEEFLSHLRHVAIRKPIHWAFRVISDAELVTAWLASIALKGEEIRDGDAHKISTKYLTIPDLVVPPDLVIIRMGVKVARNAASPEVLAEAVNTRFHEGKPTWIWDEPHHPLNTGHLFWSDEVSRTLRAFPHLTDLGTPLRKRGSKLGEAPVQEGPPGAGKSTTRKSLRGRGE